LVAGILLPILGGYNMVTYPTPTAGKRICTLVHEHSAALVANTPSGLRAMFKAAKEPNPFTSLHYCLSSGVKMPPSLTEAARQHFGVEVLECYGTAESLPFAAAAMPAPIGDPETSQPTLPTSCKGCIGAPLPGVAVRITGLYTKKGQAAPLEYTVRFFDAEHLSQPSSWALEEVSQAAALELVPEELTDFYQQPITRLEYCRLTMQVLRQKTGLTTEELVETYHRSGVVPTFSDCSDQEVLAAAAIGAVFGPGDGTFRPEGLITRQDAAVMLLQAAAALGVEIPSIDGLLYQDMEQVSAYARPAVLWTSQVRDGVSGKSVMSGVGGGRFDPQGTYTREQAMLTALRLFRAKTF
jgi:acyl-coenzyme A synthetase/AMP-(fatty) acid ligase